MNKTLVVGSVAAFVTAVVAISTMALTGSSTAPWLGSFNASYQSAAPGTTIEVPAGSYGNQVISSKTSARNGTCSLNDESQCVKFVTGGPVTISGSLEIRGSGVMIDGANQMRVSGYVDTEADSSTSYPDHVVVQNLQSTSFGVFNADTVTFKNLDIGPAYVGVGTSSCAIVQGPGIENKIGLAGGQTFVPRNVTLDGIHVHDQTSQNKVAREAGDCHFGGLFLVTVDGLTIRNSVFERNVVYDIQVQNFGGAPVAKNVLIENSSFGCGTDWGYNGGGCVQRPIQFDYDPGTQFTLRNNKFANGPGGGWGCYVGTCGGLSGLVATGNTDYPPSPDAPPLSTPPPPPVTTVTTDTTPAPPVCGPPVLGWKLPTRATITLTWPSVAGATGYRLYKDGKSVSTASATATSAKFGSLPYADTLLGVAAVCPDEKLASLTTFETRGVR